MSNSTVDETRDLWNSAAEDWQTQVGEHGDANRRLNSDPVLWKFAGDVSGLRVLDAGCGTGYLTGKLMERGARVTGVDISERMIGIAQSQNPTGDFQVDSCAELKTVGKEEFDLVVANYVLMDTPDLEDTIGAFHRALKPRGIAVVVFSHPCFPEGRAESSDDDTEVRYTWDQSYFEDRKCVDPPWGHFKSSFIWFHRPLSAYWKVFKEAGFEVLDFDEPHITEDRFDQAKDENEIRHWQMHPCSVAFKLGKSPANEDRQ